MEEHYPAVTFSIPPLSLCGDNAAMIGAAGTMAYLKGHRSGMDMNGLSGMELTSL